MAPPGWHSIQPAGLASSILGVAVAFSILSTTVMALRVFVRCRMRNFSLEDWLMCVGYVINMVHNSVICYGTFTGLGTADEDIPGGTTGPIYMEGVKSIFLWQVFFLSGFVFIKCSICLTLLRIATIKSHRIILWALIGVTVVSTIFVDLYILLQCRPIPTMWGEDPNGTCLPSTVTVAITFIISAFNLVTDITTAILPFLMLKNVQLTRRKRVAVIGVLSLGVLASIATIARLPFGTAYFATSDYMVGLGNIILWTIVECDLALVAGSLPMLRTLFTGLDKKQSSSSHAFVTSATELQYLGSKGYERHKGIDPGRNIIVQQDYTVARSEQQAASESKEHFTSTFENKAYC